MTTVVQKPAICGVCPGGCAVVATLEDGRLVGTEPDRENPYAAICVRGRSAPEIIYSPDRLTSPLIRTGERGKGQFRKATWDEALALTAKSMKDIKSRYGAQAMMYHYGRGAFEQSVSEFGKDWLYPFGSPNVAGVSSLCAVATNILAPVPTFGIRGWNLRPDIENSKMIVVWGANPITDSPPFMLPRILNAAKCGAKLVAIDHMRSDIVLRAQKWMLVRSGTDGALALGMLRIIINEGIYNREFVDNWTIGFDDLRDYVQVFTPEEVERITRVPAADVVSLAREIADTRHVSLVTYTGLEYTNSGVQNIRAVFLLWALTGNLDVPGGLCISPGINRKAEVSEIKTPRNVPRIGAREYPLFNELVGNAQYLEMPKAVLQGDPYPVKGILINGASTLINYPQPEILEKAYSNLDFLAVIDMFMTKDALYADVVFSAASLFEKMSYQRYVDRVRLRDRVIEPLAESRNDLLILAALAERLGYGNMFPQTEEEALKRAFAGKPELLRDIKANPAGVKLETPEIRHRKWELGLLRRDGNAGFDTPSGKVEIASSMLSTFGYDALPIYTEPVEGPLAAPQFAEKYPLVLNTGARLINTFRSQHLNIPDLVKIQEKPLVLINPADAAQRGIAGGDKVVVFTGRGQLSMWAKVTDAVVPGGVEVNVGGGGPIQMEAWREANTNAITDFCNRDPISGFPIFKALLCEIAKVISQDDSEEIKQQCPA